MAHSYLVRYGAAPEVSRFSSDLLLERASTVVVQSHRGLQLGTVLEREQRPRSAEPAEEKRRPVVRLATADDIARARQWQSDCETEFAVWCERIADWDLSLELLELEWTLDRSRLILYVLTERGPDATKLALQAAAAGLGPIEVQPVTRDGLVAAESHGCGSGTCGCHT